MVLYSREKAFSDKHHPPSLTSARLHCCYNISMSPTVFKKAGFRFFFFSREEARAHIHVVSGDGEAKFWLEPEIELARNYHFSRKQLKEIKSLIEVHQHELIGAWTKHFGS